MSKKNDASWRLHYAAVDHAAKEGEEIASVYDFTTPPIDPFEIIHAERSLIHAEGYDFGDAFDGRIKYVGPRFLICYNTRYNRWQHHGTHHSKVIFTVAHELGHFFLPAHREYLVTSRHPHGSLTEFTTDLLVEQQADAFASGLLTPRYLLRSTVNQTNFPSLEEIKRVRKDFQVSLTGLLVRWTQLSDFPSATIVTKDGRIQYGWVSQTLRERGAWRLRKGEPVTAKTAAAFINNDPTAAIYRDATGAASISNWIDFDPVRLLTEEHYFAVPHSGTVWILVTADETELPDSYWE